VKQILTILALMFLFATSVMAADINPTNMVGSYRIEAKALGKIAVFLLHVLPENQCEVTREFSDGHLGKLCNGTYSLSKEGARGQDLYFRSVFTCPDDRSIDLILDLNLASAKVRDLEKGTSVQVSSKDLPFAIYGKIKKY
jgi:hypothetical protein